VRLTFLIHDLGMGGAQRAVVMLANKLVSRGVSVDIVVVVDSVESAYCIDSRVMVRSARLAVASGSGFAAVFQNIRRVSKLRSILSDLRPDCAIGIGYSANVLVGLSCIGSSVRAIGAEHSSPEHYPSGLVWRIVRRYCYRYLESVICLSSEASQWLLANTRVKHAPVIPNGIELPLENTGEVADVAQWVGTKRMILSVGRLVESKQFDQLIEVFARLTDRYPDYVLVILGDGSEKRALQKLAQRRSVAQSVVMPGTVGNLADWYSAATVFVSVSRLEGFPYGLLEAMAHGLPCVSYDCSTGPRDMINDGESGVLVQLDDRDAMYTAINRVLDDAHYRKSLAENAVAVKEQFSLDAVCSRWLDYIQSGGEKKLWANQ